MPAFISSAWRELVYAVGLIVALICFEYATTHRFPTVRHYTIAFIVLAIVTSCCELIPYYYFGHPLCSRLRVAKNIIGLIGSAILLIAYVRFWIVHIKHTRTAL